MTTVRHFLGPIQVDQIGRHTFTCEIFDPLKIFQWPELNCIKDTLLRGIGAGHDGPQ